MMSLPKTMEKCGHPRNQSKCIYRSKDLDESYPKMYVFSNLSNFVKSYGHLIEILALLSQALTKYG